MRGGTFGPLLALLRPYRGAMGVVIGLALLVGALESLFVAALFPVFSLIVGAATDASPALGPVWRVILLLPGDRLLVSAAAFLIAVALTLGLVRLLYTYTLQRLITRVVVTTKRQVFSNVLRSDYELFVREKKGDLIHAVRAPDIVGYVVAQGGALAAAATTSAFLVGVMFALSWQATVLAAGVGLLYMGITRSLSRWYFYPRALQRNAAQQQESVLVAESLDGIRHVKAYQLDAQILNAHEQATRTIWDTAQKENIVSESLPAAVRTLAFVGFGSVVLVAAFQGAQTATLLPTIGTVGFGLLRLLPVMTILGDTRVQIARQAVHLELTHSWLTRPPSTVREGAREFDGIRESIAFDAVTFHHGDKLVLSDLSLRVPKGRTVAIVGASGAGKTTCLDLALRLYDPVKGAIRVDGVDVRDYTLASWRRSVALVSQDPFLLHATVEENIRFGLADASHDEIIEAAKRANAHEFIEQLPKGYATVLGDRGMRLSGGQKQRIAIARALLRTPSLLLLDEPTSSLDNASEALVQAELREIAHHTTILMVAHRLSTVRNADRIVYLRDGRIVEEGTHDELMEKDGEYAFLYQAEARAARTRGGT